MRDILLDIGQALSLENLDKLTDEELKEIILKHIEKRCLLEKSLFILSEDLAFSSELSIRVISTVNRILYKIYSDIDFYRFIAYCFDEFIRIIPAENISFMEKHPDLNYLILKVGSGKIKLRDFKTKIFDIDDSLAGRVFKKGHFIYIADIKKNKKFNLRLSTLPIRSVLSVPVKIQNEIVGVINFSHPDTNAFNESCIFFFISLVHLFSTVLTNFKLYRENLKFNEYLKKEVQRQTLELQKLNKKLYKASITDSLTGIPNRRFFFKRLEEEHARSLRYGDSFCLVLFDLDGLKKVNDTFGHPEGDRLIKLFSKILKNNTRKEDIIARIGGDEFGCILIGASLQGAKKFAENIKESFKSKYKKTSVSTSGAVGCMGTGLSFTFYKSYKEFFEQVDKGLFQAKKSKDTIKVIETD